MDALSVRKEEKLWGRNHIIHLDNSFQICHIHIAKGGYCSNHFHEHKWNQFYIISGKLMVSCYNRDGTIKSTTMVRPMECIKIPPGLNHKFEAIEETEALEIYWSELSEHDIVRTDIGGIKS